MTLWLCATCGVEYADTPQPPETDCAICADDRQYLPPTGQRWTTLAELQEDRQVTVEELEADLYAVTVAPRVGIGQRGLLVRTPGGNLLWDPPGYFDDEFIETLQGLGGVAAIAASHPHLTGLPVSLSEQFGNTQIYWGEDDRRWIQRPDDRITLWSGSLEVLPGLTLVQCGGHFAGSAVLHWAAGTDGGGVMMSGDTFLVGADRKTVSFMRSYPNLIPLSQRLIEKVVRSIAPWPFERLYSGFAPGLIESNASAAVRFSAERYIGWLRDEIRDPDERI